MNEILVGRFDGFRFIGYSQKLAFAGVKFHFPFFSQICKVLRSFWRVAQSLGVLIVL